MLKLTLRPGDFIDVGENIRVVFSGGSANNIHLLIDAPKDVNIVRNTAQQRREKSPYYAEPKLSPKARRRLQTSLCRRRKADRMARPQGTAVKTIIKQGNPRLSVFIINKKM